MVKQIALKLHDSEMVLVGLGEDIDFTKTVRKDKKYLELKNNIEDNWLVPFIERQMILQGKTRVSNLYKHLAGCLENKNYFIVSICQDGIAEQSGLDKERIVTPCGGYDQLQCSCKCTSELFDIPKELDEQVETFIKGEISTKGLLQPICPNCGQPLVFNNITVKEYAEDGYLSQWQKYTRWLQGTLNRKLCILELGVGMRYPTVIRWPFEKVAFFNQKAEFYRVHTNLYQISEEAKERAYGIGQSPEDFLKELFNEV